MKDLNQFIIEYIVKKKLEKPIDSEDHYDYFPETKEELIENMEYMFYDCKNFDCDLSKWNVSNVISMSSLFNGCKNFEGKGLDKWDVSKAEDIRYIFSGCDKIAIPNWYKLYHKK